MTPSDHRQPPQVGGIVAEAVGKALLPSFRTGCTGSRARTRNCAPGGGSRHSPGHPDLGQALSRRIAEKKVAAGLALFLAPVKGGVAQQGHAGADMAVEFDEGHALVDEAAAPGRPADALAGQVDAAHGGGEQAAQTFLGRRVLPVHERQVDARRAFHGRGVAQAPVHHVVVEHFRGRMLVRGDDVGDVDFVHLVIGGEIGQQGQLVGIALHDHEGHAQAHGPVQTGAAAVELHDMFLDQRQLAVAAIWA